MSGAIDIIYCYRDREAERVEASLQSLASQENQDFHVTFIDYGSRDANSKAVETICKNFSFCSYYYINSLGKMWNRGDALNQGILLSRGDYLFFSDIDMLFLPGFIDLLHRLKLNNKANFFPVGYLSPRSSKKIKKTALEKLPFKKSGDYASGMVLAPRQHLQKINGYHTFYSLWGLEDNDLRHRLQLHNFAIAQVMEVYLLHQYHTPVPEDQSLPEGWIQFMKDHFKSLEQQKENTSGITQGLSVMGRPALQRLQDPGTKVTELAVRKLYLRHILLEAISRKTPTAFYFKAVLPDQPGLVHRYGKTLSKLLKRTGLHVDLRSPYDSQYVTKKEILSEIYFLLKSSAPAILDYYLEEKKDGVQLILVLR